MNKYTIDWENITIYGYCGDWGEKSLRNLFQQLFDWWWPSSERRRLLTRHVACRLRLRVIIRCSPPHPPPPLHLWQSSANHRQLLAELTVIIITAEFNYFQLLRIIRLSHWLDLRAFRLPLSFFLSSECNIDSVIATWLIRQPWLHTIDCLTSLHIMSFGDSPLPVQSISCRVIIVPFRSIFTWESHRKAPYKLLSSPICSTIQCKVLSLVSASNDRSLERLSLISQSLAECGQSTFAQYNTDFSFRIITILA